MRMLSNNDLPIRLPRTGEPDQPFIEWLDGRVGRQTRQRLVAFIEEWDHLRDEIQERHQREPTVTEYSERWRTPLPTVYRHLGEFRSVFGVKEPGVLCQLLWDGMPRLGAEPDAGELMSLMAVRVVPTSVQ